MKIQPLFDKALRNWPALAVDADLNAAEWQASVLSSRDDARMSNIVVLLRHESLAPLVLKHDFKPIRPDHFAKSVQAHISAQEGFPSGVPEVFAFDIASQSVLMSYAPAEPLSVLLEGAKREVQAQLLARAGAWLAAYHRAGLADQRVFQPKYTMNYLRQIYRETADGSRPVASYDLFKPCAKALLLQEETFENRQTTAAQSHGDMHMRNLLIGQSGAWGIDFQPAPVVPVGHDIARLLADYAILRAPHTQIEKGDMLPRFAIEAFFDGYDLVGPDDPSVQHLVRHRILAEWWGLPAQATERSWAQQVRFDRIQSLVARVFPPK